MGRRRIQTTVFLGLLIESGNSHLELHERTRCPVKFRAAVILMAECSQPHVQQQQQNCRHRAFVTSHHPRFCYVLSSLIYKMSTSILAVFFRTACKSTTASNERSRPRVCLVKIDWHYQTSPLSQLSLLLYMYYLLFSSI